MTYQILNPETVVDYVKNLPELNHYFSDFSTLEVEEIGDGNVNYVYRIKHPSSGKSIILKQAVPYLRIVGESFPLSRERMNFEIMALTMASQYSPTMVPQIYHSSIEQSLVIMQDLVAHNIVRGEIIKGTVFPHFADHMSSYLAKNLFLTSDLALSSGAKKALVKQFINPDLCKLTEDFVFSHPYEAHETNVYNPELSQLTIDKVQKDREVKIAVAQMKSKFINQAEALLHGDLHIGSIMANVDETYVIDPEFAFYGPMGFDVGALIGNLYMSYFSHAYEAHLKGEQSKAYRQWLLETISAIWTQFSDKFQALWLTDEAASDSLQWQYENGRDDFKAYIDTYMHSLLADTIGFAACKMMRRVIGLAKVADFADIPDLTARAAIESNIITMAAQMVVKRDQYRSIEALNALAVEIESQNK